MDAGALRVKDGAQRRGDRGAALPEEAAQLRDVGDVERSGAAGPPRGGSGGGVPFIRVVGWPPRGVVGFFFFPSPRCGSGGGVGGGELPPARRAGPARGGA